jgi:hypothetical protein
MSRGNSYLTIDRRWANLEIQPGPKTAYISKDGKRHLKFRKEVSERAFLDYHHFKKRRD